MSDKGICCLPNFESRSAKVDFKGYGYQKDVRGGLRFRFKAPTLPGSLLYILLSKTRH